MKAMKEVKNKPELSPVIAERWYVWRFIGSYMKAKQNKALSRFWTEQMTSLNDFDKYFPNHQRPAFRSPPPPQASSYWHKNRLKLWKPLGHFFLSPCQSVQNRHPFLMSTYLQWRRKPALHHQLYSPMPDLSSRHSLSILQQLGPDFC